MPSSQFAFPEEPNANNIISILQSIGTQYRSMEEARWNESNTDVRFWAGDQDYISQFYSFAPNYNVKSFFFNIIRQPICMVSGYQRQHRKGIGIVPTEYASQHTADQFNKLLNFSHTKRQILEKFSDACEQATTSGFVLIQPYLDFTDDPVNGILDLKVWEYNSFLMDPFTRDHHGLTDCNFIWIQKYLSRKEAASQFPDQAELIATMSSYSNSDSQFYFLPENYNIAKNDLLILTYYWYRSTRKKKRLYNQETGEITDWNDSAENIQEYLKVFPELEEIEVDIPTWNVAVMLNKHVVYIGHNPLGFDECPFIGVAWDYDGYIAQPNLRIRSLVRYLRDAQFLFNRRIILNHDISESSINSGWIYKENSVVNEEAIKYAGQGKDIIIKEGFEISDVQKIVPNAVPPSDMQLADQMLNLINPLSGVNPELMGMAKDTKAGITEMLRQGAGLVTLQKYFDQWDRSLKILGMLELKIIQNKWTPFKVSRIIKEEPTPEFYSKNFSQYDVLPEETLNTSVQRQNQFSFLLQLREMGIPVPTDFLLKNSTIQGKDELIEAIAQQEKMQGEMAQQKAQLELAMIEAQLQNSHASTAEKLAMAKERVGRTKSNLGLYEERLAEVSRNHALATKDKISAVKEFLDTVRLYGEVQTQYAVSDVDEIEDEDQTREFIKKRAVSTEALTGQSNQLN